MGIGSRCHELMDTREMERSLDMEVTFRPCSNGKIVANADVVMARGVIVRGFKIVEGSSGLFASVPSRGFMAEGKQRYYNLVSFLDDDARKRFLSELLEDYERWKEKGV